MRSRMPEKVWTIPQSKYRKTLFLQAAFARYEAHRKPRTSVIQAISSANTWMREGAGDTSWLYGYDAWNAPLDHPAAHAAAA